MKKIILSVFSMVLVSTMLMAQADTTWKKGAVLSVNFNQVGLTNWAGGGANTIAGNTILSAFANYLKKVNGLGKTMAYLLMVLQILIKAIFKKVTTVSI